MKFITSRLRQLATLSSLQRHILYKINYMTLRGLKMRSIAKQQRNILAIVRLRVKIMSIEIQKRILIETPIPKYTKGGEPQSAIYYENGVECVIPEARKALDANYRQVGNYADDVKVRGCFHVGLGANPHYLIHHNPVELPHIGIDFGLPDSDVTVMGSRDGKTYAIQQAIYEALNKTKNDNNKG